MRFQIRLFLCFLFLVTDITISASAICSEIFPSSSSYKDREIVHFSFTQKAQHAHVRDGGLIIDLGSKSRFKYSPEPEYSGFLKDIQLDGRTYSGIRFGASRVVFDILPDERKWGRVIIAGRSGDGANIQVLLNNEKLETIYFDSDELQTAVVEFDDILTTGTNELVFRCSHKNTKESHIPCAYIDYVKIEPDSMAEPALPTGECLDKRLQRWKDSDVIHLHENESITYNLLIPDSGELAIGSISTTGDEIIQFEIEMLDDNGVVQSLFHKRISTSISNVRIPLTGSNKSAAITFRSIGGEVFLSAPRISGPLLDDQTAQQMGLVQNVIWILVDTLRADRLGPYNSKRKSISRNLTRFASESLVFDAAWAPASWTKPSVASLLTGLFPSSHGVQRHGEQLPKHISYAPELFKQNGMVTAGFVANGYICDTFGFKRGWDYWKDNRAKKGAKWRAHSVFREAVHWLEKVDPSAPFFAYIHTVDPHAPYQPPKKYRTQIISNSQSTLTPEQSVAWMRRVKKNETIPSRIEKLALEQWYNGEVAYLDAQFGRFMQALKKRGLLKNTLIIVTADHGEEFFDHGSLGHSHSLYEELIRVPLFIRFPEGTNTRGKVIPHPVQLVDILPTTCELVGIQCPPNLEGQSLLWTVSSTDSIPHSSGVFAELPDSKLHAVRVGHLKAIYQNGVPHIFNLNHDQNELANLVTDSFISRSILRETLGLHLGTKQYSKKGDVSVMQDESLNSITASQLKALGYMGD